MLVTQSDTSGGAVATAERPRIGFSVKEVATMLGCSRAHVYRLIAAEQLGAVDIAGKDSTRTKYRVRQSDIDAYLGV